jgi:hypothetical protein
MKTLSRQQPLPSHADLNLVGAEDAQELGAGELGALIGVEDLGSPKMLDCLLERGDAEIARQRQRDPPRQDLSRRPVHDRHEIDEAARHGDVGDVGRADVVRPGTCSLSGSTVTMTFEGGGDKGNGKREHHDVHIGRPSLRLHELARYRPLAVDFCTTGIEVAGEVVGR